MQGLRLQCARRKVLDDPGQRLRAGCGRISRFVIGHPSGSAYQVRVTVDKPGHHHASTGVYQVCLARDGEVLQSTARSDLMDAAVDNQNGAVLNEAEVPEIGPAAGTARSAQRQELPGASYQSGARDRTNG